MIDEEVLRSIEKLHQMKQSGIISEADFDKVKEDLLNGRPRYMATTKHSVRTEVAPYPEMPADQDFSGWLVYALRRYAVFNGRSCRKEYWVFNLTILVSFFIFFIGLLGETNIYRTFERGINVFTGMGGLALAALAVPAVAVQVRRFHDQDKTGWFALLNLVPYLGPFIIAGFMLIDGTPGDNQYGPDPKDR